MRQTSSSLSATASDIAGGTVGATVGATSDHAACHGGAPVVMLPCTIATDSALGCAMALAFAGAGWDICVYFDVRRPGERADAERCCAAVASLGRFAVALPVDIPGLGHASGAGALIGRCADSGEGVGRLPRCLINAPAEIEGEDLADTPMRIADGDVAPNIDGSVLLRLNEVNVAPALALSQAFHRVWRQIQMGADTAIPDLAVINIIDSGMADGGGNVIGHAGDNANAAQAASTAHHLMRRLPFLLTQASLRAATPLLAKAFAPSVRVAGLSTLLLPTAAPGRSAVHQAGLTDAVCEAALFLANASTTTGSILLTDGGAHAHRAARDTGQFAGRQSVASVSDTVPEIAADPHGE